MNEPHGRRAQVAAWRVCELVLVLGLELASTRSGLGWMWNEP
jgi:hypothetical protein